MTTDDRQLDPIGFIRSSLRALEDAPRQGNESAPDAWLVLREDVVAGLEGIAIGDEIIVLTWLHQASRDVLQTHPRNDARLPLTGVFATRSPDRPNPIGLHRVRVLAVRPGEIEVGPLEAINGTPVVDIKPVLSDVADD
jgi:tRNA-Thr(GGU) m(6)t(6)A37 methyltransferase TsaA